MKETATDDVRIQSLRPLLPPAILMEELPCSEHGLSQVTAFRKAVSDVLTGKDNRLVVVVGPCSIHDPKAGLEYAERLLEESRRLSDDLLIVMRTYFEKPRTTIGWKGLINDPHLDDSFSINQGLRIARGFLRDVVELGLPTGTEFLDPISPQFIADLVSWGAIGARTVESQVHRELASGLSMPVGFKNGTGGSIQIAVDALRSARHPHRFLSVTKQGLAAIVETTGNSDCHVILRGGGGQPNYSAETIGQTAQRLEKAGVNKRLMIDCSHANSGKDPERQPAVAEAVAEQLEGGNIFGVMLESFLLGGRQDAAPGKPLTYGQSITDGCLSWEATVPVLELLARARR
ncbi:MAG: 3-deoxy-7-phosphoheptulonate synthase [Polyangiaceae bacterium]|nr:3-deoxy-7-phosphoheptulonate synthase [Myxococcales bacterium]MCB9586685.1 3-deoxy-7-phosphoheptulonate synthase [Polyangiaceae bacterium]MCB9606192.1 3-deoxy-7-phosphoheptulonate synthase [Polyangiaceae bacterium]